MPATLRNTTITEKYFNLVKEKYAKPKEEGNLGSYVNKIPLPSIVPLASKQKQKREANQPLGKKRRDIREMFAKSEKHRCDCN